MLSVNRVAPVSDKSQNRHLSTFNIGVPAGNYLVIFYPNVTTIRKLTFGYAVANPTVIDCNVRAPYVAG